MPNSLRLFLRLGSRIGFIIMGYIGTTGSTLVLSVLAYLCILAFLFKAPTTLVQSEQVNISEFGVGDETNDFKIKRTIFWPRLFKALLFIFWSLGIAIICYLVGKGLRP